MNVFTKGVTFATKSIVGNEKKVLTNLATTIVKSSLNKREAYREKVRILKSNHLQGWQYNELILRHFVKRRFTFYGTNKKSSIGKIKQEIQHPKLATNIILTGAAGSGKSTALKWLFMNTNIKGYPALYLCASMFDSYKSLDEVLSAIAKTISKYNKCIVFFDGLDELKCIKGVSEEFNQFIHFFNEKSNYIPKHAHYRFVIATRQEHFSFHKMIIKKKSKKRLDNYRVFEIQPLNPTETLKVCKTIERLSKLDIKENTHHFKDKWPSSGGNNNTFSRSEYLRLLRKYLKETSSDQSLLTYPLLCRYAYPIIREWNTLNQSYSQYIDGTQSAPICCALESYIKWEFHDNYQGHTESDEGRNLLNKYKQEVFEFLTEIAGSMGKDDLIDKEHWEKLKYKNNIEGNASFCALQEFDDDHMAFIHKSFKDYFLACYFAKNTSTKRKKTKKELATLLELLNSSTMFCTMYTEQLLKSNSRITKIVTKHLMQTVANDSPAKLSNFVRGSARYSYQSEAPFTVEEYFQVFPYGDCEYCGIRFNRDKFQKLYATGILEITENEHFENYKSSEISKKLNIKGIKYSPYYWKGFKHTTRNFALVHNGSIIDIGGYWTHSWSDEDIFLLSKRSELKQLFTNNPSIEEIQRNEALRLLLLEKEQRDQNNYIEEQIILSNWIISIVKFIGEDYDYFCLFDEASLHIYQCNSANESLIKELFLKGFSRYPVDYISLYGQYRAKTIECDTATELGQFYNTKICIPNFIFDHYTPIEENNVLQKYYHIHWNNIKLLSLKKEEKVFNTNNINHVLETIKLFDLYKEADSLLADSPNEKMQLYLSDERLFTYYALGKGEEMVNLACETLDLCDKYHHTAGADLRKFLIDDETSFVGKDMEKIHAFAQDHIWL